MSRDPEFSPEIEPMVRSWWWFNERHAKHLNNPTAIEWELIRRRELGNREFENGSICSTFDANRSWVEIQEDAANRAEGTSNGGRNKVHPNVTISRASEMKGPQLSVTNQRDSLLPGSQRIEESQLMLLGLVTIQRADGRIWVREYAKEWGAWAKDAGELVNLEALMRPNEHSKSFLVIQFHPGLPSHSLRRQFDTVLPEYLKQGMPEMWNEAKRGKAPRSKEHCYVLTEKARSISASTRRPHPTNTVDSQLIKGWSAFAFIPATNSPKLAGARFRNLMEQRRRSDWQKQCDRWLTVNLNVKPIHGRFKKSAGPKLVIAGIPASLLGITMLDLKRAGIRLRRGEAGCAAYRLLSEKIGRNKVSEAVNALKMVQGTLDRM